MQRFEFCFLKIAFIMFTRVSPLILYLQAVVFIALTNYYLNPALLPPNCLTGTFLEDVANAESKTLGHGTLIDCSACIFQDGRDLLESRLSGDIDVLLPLKNSTANGRLPIENQNGGILSEKLMYLGHIYQQKGCQTYTCNQWVDPMDFQILGVQKQEQMKELGLEKMKDAQFKEASMMKRWFGAKPHEGQYHRLSSSVAGKNISSLMVKFRYNPVEDLNPQGQPVFLLHEIPDNLFIRLLLVGSVIFSILRLYSFASVHHLPFPSLLAFVFCLTFLTEHLASLGSSMAIFLIGYGMLQQKMVGILLAGAFFVVSTIGVIIIPLYSAFSVLVVIGVVVGWVLVGWKTNQTRPDLGQVLIICVFHGIVGVVYHWNFLLYANPMNLMIGLLMLHHQHHEGQGFAVKQPYKNLNFHEIEEQEDVLAKIDKALENH